VVTSAPSTDRQGLVAVRSLEYITSMARESTKRERCDLMTKISVSGERKHTCELRECDLLFFAVIDGCDYYVWCFIEILSNRKSSCSKRLQRPHTASTPLPLMLARYFAPASMILMTVQTSLYSLGAYTSARVPDKQELPRERENEELDCAKGWISP
jgi:hypothetical protein